MKFSVGVLDALFGKKIEMEFQDSDGLAVKRRVSEKWFNSMIENGDISALREVVVNVLHPYASFTDTWIVGRNIDQDAYDKFINHDTGQLYAMIHFENGESVTNLVTREIYEDFQESFPVLKEKELEDFANDMMNELGWMSSKERERK